jgi:hypothetical protein
MVSLNLEFLGNPHIGLNIDKILVDMARNGTLGSAPAPTMALILGKPL